MGIEGRGGGKDGSSDRGGVDVGIYIYIGIYL